MDFLQTLSENDFEKFRPILCPVCYKTIPSIFLFIEPKTFIPFIAIKCPNQENIATIPIKNFLTEYLLYDFENKSLVIQDSSLLDKYGITETNCIQPQDLQSLSHFKHKMTHKQTHDCVVCNPEEQGQKNTSYCAQCLQWFCSDCLVFHFNLAKNHMISAYGFNIKDNCVKSEEKKDKSHLNIRRCDNCEYIMCDDCVIGTKCNKCSDGNLEEFSLVRRNIKQNFKWSTILSLYESKKKDDKKYNSTLGNSLTPNDKEYNQIKNAIKMNRNINKIFYFMKILYANFERSKEYKNFNLLLNIKANYTFIKTLLEQHKNIRFNNNVEKTERFNFSLLSNYYNNFFYKVHIIDVPKTMNPFDKITATFYIKNKALLLVAMSNCIITYKLNKQEHTLIENKKLEDITICKMISVFSRDESETKIAFITNDYLLGFIFLRNENNLNVERYKTDVKISEIQESMFHKKSFIIWKEMKYVNYVEISEKNVIKYKQNIDKKITHFCEVSDKYVAYINGFTLYVDELFSNNIIKKADFKDFDLQSIQKHSKIVSINMLHKENKLLVLVSNNDEQFLKMQCILIKIDYSIDHRVNSIDKKITNIPFKIFGIIQVNNFIFGKVSLQNINKINLCPHLVNLYIDQEKHCLKYSYFNVEGNDVIQLDDTHYIIQQDNSLCIFENIHKKDNHIDNKTIPIPIALYNIANK